MVLLLYLSTELYIFFNLKIVLRSVRYPSLYWSLYAISILFVLLALISFTVSNQSEEIEYTHRKPLQNLLIGLTFTFIFSKLIFGSILLLIDLSRLLTWFVDQGVNLFNRSSPKITLEGRRNFLIKSGLAIAAIPFASFLYGITYGKYNYKVRKLSLTSPKLPKKFDGYRIVQISDIHAGSFDSIESVLKGVEIINDQNPDLVVFTGDLVNDRADEIDAYIDVFRKIQSKDGIYSITGNHDYGDYYKWKTEDAKKENFNSLIEKHNELGFDLLMNENRKIQRGNSHVNIVGIENWGLPPFPQKGDLNKALNGVDDSFTILLSHDPSHWDAETIEHEKHIDLTLSGHTHGMQFGVEIPGIKWSPVKYKYPKWAGLYEEAGQYLYVNRGFGFLGLPGRVGIWPEITVIDLKSES